ncbi:MAG: hypothetical protein ACRDDH_17240 [Cetobacterium sp.]|uniref:hypothetical protein n=1 Tax=Cetobacterium sp. TaxID=2071632 RepID=UPI003EE705EF
MPNIEEIDEISLGVDSFAPVVDNRSSSEELERIKEYSDENLDLILPKINTNDDDEKRSVAVNLIAALDYYIHEIIIWGIVQITTNKFPEGKEYSEVEVSIKHLKKSIENPEDIFNNPDLKIGIIEKIRGNSYQKWRKIREGLKLILPSDIEAKIADLTSGKNGISVFQSDELDNISNKRHIIVHHFDREYTNDSLRNSFDLDCKNSFNLIKLIIDSVHEIIKEYDETKPEQY